MTGNVLPNDRPRADDLGLQIGTMSCGPHNAITDVPDVRVGHVSLISGHGAHQAGRGPVRTGVTVVLPHGDNLFRHKVPAGIFVLNGFGKCLGQEQVEELGTLESPIAMTGTMNVGIVADGLIQHAINQNPDCGLSTATVNPMVTECSDGYLNDAHGRHVRQEHVLHAIKRAKAGPVAEGNVGAGVGMSLFGFKGGIGTASRVLPADLGGHTVGVLVLGNFGQPWQLTIAGVPLGQQLQEIHGDAGQEEERGSVIVLIATDAPMLDRALRRMARRAALGLARTGSIAGNGSGDYILAFSNAIRIPHDPAGLTMNIPHILEHNPLIDTLFQAVVEATEEAVINALLRAQTLTGRDGHTRHALPLDATIDLLKRAGRLK